MAIDGLDHIQIAMPAGGEEQARAFYAGRLGLTEIDKPEALRARGGCWFRGGGVELHLGVQADFTPATKAHPGFRVDDFEAAHAEFGGEIDTKVEGVRRLFVDDPFGNRLELAEWPRYGAVPNLLVNDLEASLPWYVDKLGFALQKRLDGPPRRRTARARRHGAAAGADRGRSLRAAPTPVSIRTVSMLSSW